MDQYSLGDSDEQIRLRGAWEQVLRRFQPEVSPAWYERFLRPLRPTNLEEGVATMAAPGRFVYEWVRERYAKKLEEALTDELGEPISLRLVAESREKAASVLPQASVAISPADPGKFKPFDR